MRCIEESKVWVKNRLTFGHEKLKISIAAPRTLLTLPRPHRPSATFTQISHVTHLLSVGRKWSGALCSSHPSSTHQSDGGHVCRTPEGHTEWCRRTFSAVLYSGVSPAFQPPGTRPATSSRDQRGGVIWRRPKPRKERTSQAELL